MFGGEKNGGSLRGKNAGYQHTLAATGHGVRDTHRQANQAAGTPEDSWREAPQLCPLALIRPGRGVLVRVASPLLASIPARPETH